ncbi:hypothetical protein F4604DRAFT_1922101 [Suillus subluteus]|nr:hypothetical protein F4604DRAFT_1922101 [Suillus subluteus]
MANYTTVLLGSVNTVPDDTAVSDLPRGQVDYLSHEWREEDVWRSWRSMTRLKNEITNGMRLENASWRTWWKQRNKLSTITPPPPPPPSLKPSANTAAALDLPMLSSSPPTTKPILKHRSIMELLTSDLPSSPKFSPPESEEDEILHIHSDHEAPKHLTGPGVGGITKRPPLTHTKSDTHISLLGPQTQGSPDAAIVPGQKRKHISFNTFVEQCIAIEKPKKKRTVWNVEYTNSKTVGSNDYSQGYSFEDDGYDEDSEDGIIDETDELLFGDEDERPSSPSHLHASYPRSAPSHPRSSPPPQNTSPVSSSTSEEEDEDEVLEMRVRHANAGGMLPSRSSSHSSSSTSSSSSRSRPPKARSASYTHHTNGTSVHHRRTTTGALMRTPSSDKELVTIALIAPTILKTRTEEDEHYPYTHSHGYPHPPSSGKWYAYGAQDSPVELVYVPPSYICADIDGVDGDGVVDDLMAERYHKSLKPAQFFDGPLVASPSPDEDVPMKEVDTRTYFEQHERVEPEAEGPESGPRYSHGGARNIPIVRNLGRPEVVVSSEDTSGERLSRSDSRSRSRSRSHSRSRTPSPSLASIQAPPQSTAVPVPRSSSFSSPSGLLQPPDVPRGRSASSSTLSSQAEGQQARGRSVTRTSSFSDRDSESMERLGSLSPDGGFGLAIGIGSAYIGGRERDARSDRQREGVVRVVERGRDRVGRRTDSNSGSGSSLSPEDPRVPMVVTASLPEPPKKKFTSASSSSSDSSTISAVSVSTVRPPPQLVLNTGPSTQTGLMQAASASATSVSSSSTVIPPAPNQAQTIKEEQECISRQPTPANSPILAMRPGFPSPKSYSAANSSRHDRKPSAGTSRSPTRDDDRQQGGLVGRAVEIMAFLNSFWHSGAQASASP